MLFMITPMNKFNTIIVPNRMKLTKYAGAPTGLASGCVRPVVDGVRLAVRDDDDVASNHGYFVDACEPDLRLAVGHQVVTHEPLGAGPKRWAMRSMAGTAKPPGRSTDGVGEDCAGDTHGAQCF